MHKWKFTVALYIYIYLDYKRRVKDKWKFGNFPFIFVIIDTFISRQRYIFYLQIRTSTFKQRGKKVQAWIIPKYRVRKKEKSKKLEKKTPNNEESWEPIVVLYPE